MDAIVRGFNGLPRRRTVHTGPGPNYWHFSVRTVKPDFNPRDIVFLISSANELMHVASPPKGTTILSLPSPSVQADMIAFLLLDSFRKGVLKGSNAHHAQFAPCSWSCNDTELAQILEEKFKDLGMREELCTVQRGSQKDNDLYDAIWAQMRGLIMGGFRG